MIDWILKTVAEVRGDRNRVGFLYDIGCNVEKGILKVSIPLNFLVRSQGFRFFFSSHYFMNQRNQFAIEHEQGRLKFGTSVFHAYVHEWGCQLDYNPRLNIGWGLSDGEGLERRWSDLSPLIRPNRYATAQHRLISISLRSIHGNEVLRGNAG